MPIEEPSLDSLVSEKNSAAFNLEQTSDALRRSQKMAHLLAFKPKELPQKAAIRTLLNKIPLLSGFIRSVSRTGESVGRLAELNEHFSDMGAAGSGTHFTGVVLFAMDFFRIPAIYLSSALAGEKPPITLSKNARWLYSGVMLGLTIAALAVPVAAPPIAFALAGLSFGVTLFTMGKIFYQRQKLRKDLKSVEREIANETKELNELQDETKSLEKQLSEAVATKNKEHVATLTEKLDAVTKRFDELYDSKKAPLQALHDKKFQYEEKLKKKGMGAVVDKGISVAISALALAGLTLTLFFPPVGLGLLAASAAFGALYMVARVTYPFIKRLFAKKSSTPTATESPAKPEARPEVSPSDELEDSLLSHPEVSLGVEHHVDHSDHLAPVSESTTKAMNLLFHKEAAHILQDQIANSQWMGKAHATLSSIVDNHDPHALLKFFTALSLHVQSAAAPSTADDLKQLFSNLHEIQPGLSSSTILLLKEAVSAVQTGQIKLSEQETSDLLACPPLKDFLHEQAIDLQIINTPKATPISTAEAQPVEIQPYSEDTGPH